MSLGKDVNRFSKPPLTKQLKGQPKTTPTEEKEKFIWRMHQPQEHQTRKYQLFPSKESLTIKSGKRSPEQEGNSSTMAAPSGTERDRPPTCTTSRPKIKDLNLLRRRKISGSVPELEPMTTVQEIAMDSPTIPGRPPMHERSISAPGGGGGSWRQNMFGESMVSLIAGPAFDESAEIALEGQTKSRTKTPRPTTPPRQPLSPRMLAPLVIPTTSGPVPKLSRQLSSSPVRPSTKPPEVPPKSARMMENYPYPRASPSPASAMSLTSTAPTSVTNTPLILNTPVSALPASAPNEHSVSPMPWNTTATHTGNQSDATQRTEFALGHRRGESEASIMDRGRPKNRPEMSYLNRKPSMRMGTSPFDDQKAFETLPEGVRAKDANSKMTSHELEVIRKQAMGQASRFEILASRDVDELSRELRGLDERCEYLRKTHRSLRSGRRNLHDRICTYLRSPRVARFSHESILKQEEALSELDSSIDDWVSKLEQAENRRTRVRQKLLEHVAAAMLLPQHHDRDVDTPPRSPTKAHSPQRLAAPVEVTSPESIGRKSSESIRIYADRDISALLADLEDEIQRMAFANPGFDQENKANDKMDDAKLVLSSEEAPFLLSSATFKGP
ncbi:Up-regulated during septation-domain-containing protein [Calycina marina]|uniref:Up-regulated during septation-domain-containing protein n=1 Tax=Calycina marina TaxID=1763456 RepID=A0A9P7Z9B8_9HELO|nr:Up-regulated during septation-domain-containing protein [Calycina marina]